MRACSRIAECSLSYAKIMIKNESNTLYTFELLLFSCGFRKIFILLQTASQPCCGRAGCIFAVKGRYGPYLPASNFATLIHSGGDGNGASTLGVLYTYLAVYGMYL